MSKLTTTIDNIKTNVSTAYSGGKVDANLYKKVITYLNTLGECAHTLTIRGDTPLSDSLLEDLQAFAKTVNWQLSTDLENVPFNGRGLSNVFQTAVASLTGDYTAGVV